MLVNALRLPPGTVVLACSDGDFWNKGLGTIRLKVEHPDLKEVEDGGLIPICDPKWRRQDDVVFEGWGQ